MSTSNVIVSFYKALNATIYCQSQGPYHDDVILVDYEIPSGELSRPIEGDHCAAHFVLRGATKLRRLVHSGWEESLTQPGTSTLSPSGHWQRAEWLGTQRRFSVYFSKGRLCDLAGLGQSAAKSVTLDGPVTTADPMLGHTMQALYVQSREIAFSQRLATDALLHALAAAWICRHSSYRSDHRRVAPGGLAPWQVKRVVAFMMDQLDREIGLDELASLVDLSPAYFCTAFRQSTGLPPHRWQMERRLERAKELLGDRRQSITDISLAIGYANPGHFATLFKRSTGVSPREWRRTMVL